MAPSSRPQPVVTTLSLKPGDRVDAFTVVGTIATTGSAVVYKAHDELLDRYVAIKQIILGDGDTDDVLRKRIRDEAAIHKHVSARQPRHLIQFIDAVDGERGLMLVSEYYPSTSLEQVLADRGGPLDERQALGILAATAKGLEAIHAAGVVHRDLKPSNILLGEDGGLKICDFGLSALIEAQDSLSLGSVRYMAPELLRGEPADGRADLYSLGIIAYEMLAGRPNFDAAFRNVLRDQRNQAMRWMKWHTNARVSAPPLSEHVPDLPPHLVQLVARLMEKDQVRRVGSAIDVLEAIRRHFTGDSEALEHLGPGSPGPLNGRGSGEPTSAAGDTAALPTRGRLPLILAGLLLLWVVVGAGVYVIADGRRAARQEQAQAEANALIDAGIARYEEGDFTGSLENYQAVLSTWPEGSAIAQRAQLGAWKARGRLAFAGERYGEAIDHFERYQKAGGDAASVQPLILEARAGEAFASVESSVLDDIERHEFREAQQVVREARQNRWSDQQVRRLDELDVLIERRRAEVLATQRIAQARELEAAGDRAGAIAALEDLVTLPPEGTALLTQLRADLRYHEAIMRAETSARSGEYVQAIAAYNEALAVRPSEELTTKVRELDARRLTVEGAALLDGGEFEAARSRFAQALELDPDNPDALRLQQQIRDATELGGLERAGDAATAAGKYDEAIGHYEAALRISPSNAAVQQKLVDVRVQQNVVNALAAIEANELDRAETLLNAALLLQPGNGTVDQMLSGLSTRREYARLLASGDEARRAGDYGRAKRLYNNAGELIPGEEVTQRLEDTEFEQYLARARRLIAENQHDAARVTLQQASRIRVTPELTALLESLEAAPVNPEGGTTP